VVEHPFFMLEKKNWYTCDLAQATYLICALNTSSYGIIIDGSSPYAPQVTRVLNTKWGNISTFTLKIINKEINK